MEVEDDIQRLNMILGGVLRNYGGFTPLLTKAVCFTKGGEQGMQGKAFLSFFRPWVHIPPF